MLLPAANYTRPRFVSVSRLARTSIRKITHSSGSGDSPIPTPRSLGDPYFRTSPANALWTFGTLRIVRLILGSGPLGIRRSSPDWARLQQGTSSRSSSVTGSIPAWQGKGTHTGRAFGARKTCRGAVESAARHGGSRCTPPPQIQGATSARGTAQRPAACQSSSGACPCLPSQVPCAGTASRPRIPGRGWQRKANRLVHPVRTAGALSGFVADWGGRFQAFAHCVWHYALPGLVAVDQAVVGGGRLFLGGTKEAEAVLEFIRYTSKPGRKGPVGDEALVRDGAADALQLPAGHDRPWAPLAVDRRQQTGLLLGRYVLWHVEYRRE